MGVEKSIAGFRVLRLLATGTRSRVWLAPGDRVLKVLPASDAGVADEARALHLARGEHVVELLDASVDDERSVLVFPRLPRGSVAELLSVRAGLDAGEAVTALAPIAACLARMHGAGVAHGAVSADAVLFRGDGAPVIIGFGRAMCFEAGLPEIELERVDGVIADRQALLELVLAVLARVSGSRASAAAELAQRARGFELEELETRLARELFAMAAARPIRFEGDAAGGVVPRAVGVEEVAEPPVDPPPAGGAVGAVVAQVLESGPGRIVRGFVSEVWRGWSPRRRRVVIAVGAIAAVLVIALPAIPSGEPTGTTPAVAEPGPSAGAVQPELPSEVTGDDPLVALGALLRLRTDCFRDLSQLCLDDVDEQDSSALDEDRAAIDALISDGQQPVILDAQGAEVVERLGDSAIVALAPGTEPASLLLLKGEAGWRIRDYIANPRATPSEVR